MNHGEVPAFDSGTGNMRDAFGGWRKRREERERQMPNRVAEFGAIRSVPGIDGIELFQFWNAGAVHNADQIESSVGDGAGAIGEADQGEHRARSPDFGVMGAGGLECWQRENYIADGARPDEQSTTGDKIACPTSLSLSHYRETLTGRVRSMVLGGRHMRSLQAW